MRTSKKWLDAQSEHNTLHQIFPSFLSLSDLKNDNYYKLLATETPADFSEKSKLKVYKGTQLISEQGLPGMPSSIESFYVDEHEPKIPVIAISVGPSVLFYKNMKPYYKYTLPTMPINQLEIDIWKKLPNEKPEKLDALIDQLNAIDVHQLTHTSHKLLQLSQEEQKDFIKEHGEKKLQRLSNITTMTTIKKSSNDLNAVSCLIIATESGDLIFLDTQTFTVLHEARVSSFKSTPCMLSLTGQFNIDFRLVVSTREGSICILRKGWLEGRQIIKLDNPTIGLALLPIEQTIIVVCMNKTLDCYSKKGKQLWSVLLPEPAMCMVPVILSHLSITLICVALRGGSVQLYSQKNIVDQFLVPETVSTMIFGKLGQEDHVLVLVTIGGSLIIKILKRTADFKVNANESTTNDGNSSVSSSLQIPKKSPVFIEQTNRERDNATAIYHNFQSEFWRLRLTAARATADIVKSADTTISGDIGHASIKLAAEILGLGPVFTLFLTLENMSARKEAANICIILHADDRHYTLKKPYAKLPSLAPGAPIKIDFKVITVIDEQDNLPYDITPETAIIRVLVFKSGQAKPLIAATVAMPTPEPLDNGIY